MIFCLPFIRMQYSPSQIYSFSVRPSCISALIAFIVSVQVLWESLRNLTWFLFPRGLSSTITYEKCQEMFRLAVDSFKPKISEISYQVFLKMPIFSFLTNLTIAVIALVIALSIHITTLNCTLMFYMINYVNICLLSTVG